MKIAIWDDDIIFGKGLKKWLEEMDEAYVADCYHSVDDLDFILEQDYDLILMDIQLENQMTGFDMGAALYDRSCASKIIYMTSYTEKYVEQMYDRPSNRAGFLRKPVDVKKLKKNLERIERELEDENRHVIELKDVITPRIVKVHPEEIRYVMNDDHYQDFYIRNDRIRVAGKLSDWDKKLPRCFVRCHKGFLVNMQYVTQHRQHELVLKDDTVIPMGRIYGKGFAEKYAGYLEERMMEAENV